MILRGRKCEENNSEKLGSKQFPMNIIGTCGGVGGAL